MPAGSGRPDRTTILAVDDDAAALYATSRVLRAAGYHVIEAGTGMDALRLAPQAHLVVLDVNLPDLDGFEVCRRLRADARTDALPVLHLSATFVNSQDFEVGREAGADGYLTRPVEPPVLIATVRTLLFAHHADLHRRGLDARLHTLFEIAPVALAMLDASFRYDKVNPAYCALTGYSPEELRGLPGAAFTATQPEHLLESAAAVIEATGRWEGDLKFRRKDGGLADVHWRIANESLSGMRILVASDITEQLRIEAARESLLQSERAARGEAERSNRLKEEFLATLSHELRNPLNAILGWATVLSSSGGLPPPAMQGLQAIERNSRLQAQMIADLLDYAGITFGKMRLASCTVDPYASVRAALEVVQASARGAGVTIQSDFGKESLCVEADAARLQQIVWNLLSNAIKFSPQGAAVELTAGRAGESFRLTVKDHGRGIAAEFLPRIFDRFSQQDSTSTRGHGGLGLGLAIVKQLAELHGGSIEGYSAGAGLGATFVLTLPLAASAAVPAAAPGDSQRLRSLDLSDVVALVVEDDRDTRELTKRILTDAGARVIEAGNAAAALRCVETTPPNVLISDIGMADQDGYQLLRNLRSRGYGADVLPALALTAFARTQDRNEAIAAGFQEHLIKPLDPQTLIARVASLRRAIA